MTENKRFTIEYVQGNHTIFHIVDDGKHIDEIRICDLLNELNDENTQLKKQLHDCRIYNGKLYANGVKKDKPIVNDLIKQRKENTRIKQTIQEAYNNERTQIGRNVLRQLLEAIQ